MLLCLVQISHLVQCFLDLHVLFQGRLKKKCCFREGAVSMLSGSLCSSTCRVAVICLPIHCCGLCFLHMMNCVVMCTAVEVLKSWHGMCWHCKVAVNVAGLSSDFGNWNLISSVMLCGQTKYKTLIRQLSEIILNLFDSCSRQSYCHDLVLGICAASS
jgi:hypothetical protein